MTPQEQLCEKMRVEQSAYCLWLTAQPPEEILNHAYEYSVREDIILATEEMNLTLAQVRALLKSPAPLADVYKDFSKLETDYMSIVAQCVEDRADDLLKKEQQQNPPKVYRQSVTYAREHGELQQYHASCHLNETAEEQPAEEEISAAVVGAELYTDLPNAPIGSYIGSEGLPVATGETKIGICEWPESQLEETSDSYLTAAALDNDGLTMAAPLLDGTDYAIVPIMAQVEYT